MPILEYYCPDNNKIYSFYARSKEQAETMPSCPDDPSLRMERVMSGFAVHSGGHAKTQECGTGGECGDGGGQPNPAAEARMESVMRDMESEMASMSDGEPDPKLLGKMMRRMADASGEKMDDGTMEMIRKLEEGADPEKLEEQFAGMMGGMGEGGSFGGGGFSAPPSRDPNLYDYD